MTTDSVTEAYVSRQPIYRRHMDLFGYELLFRDGEKDHAVIVDGDRATASVILNFFELGMERIVGKNRAFINLTRNFILDGHCASLPSDRVVLEVLEDVTADPEIVRALKDLSARGYLIALDDFVYEDSLRPLVDLADIVKVDVLGIERAVLKQRVSALSGFDVALLAEKVETQEEFDFCNGLGFDYFQGFFLCKPKLIHGKQIPTNRMAATRLVGKLQDPDIKEKELEETIKQDVTLSYKLLRFVNSAYCALPRRVDSIGHAAMMIGTERIRIWASLLMLATMDHKPRELIVTAVVRAKMCEGLAHSLRLPATDQFFTVGLFSVLDAMLDATMAEVLEKLPLTEQISQALDHHDGPLGQVLEFAIAYERSEWTKLGDLAEQLELTPADIRKAYFESVAWTREIMDELNI